MLIAQVRHAFPRPSMQEHFRVERFSPSPPAEPVVDDAAVVVVEPEVVFVVDHEVSEPGIVLVSVVLVSVVLVSVVLVSVVLVSVVLVSVVLVSVVLVSVVLVAVVSVADVLVAVVLVAVVLVAVVLVAVVLVAVVLVAVVLVSVVSVADVAELQASVDIVLAVDFSVPASVVAVEVYSSGRPRFRAFPNID